MKRSGCRSDFGSNRAEEARETRADEITPHGAAMHGPRNLPGIDG